VIIVVVLYGEASIELLSSSVLVTRTRTIVDVGDNKEDDCVLQLPLEVRSTMFG